MLADRDQHLSGHVSAFLGPGGLILDVDAGRPFLDEQLRQLHDGRQASVTRVGVGDDRAKEVRVGNLVAVEQWRADPLLALLPVMEQLCHEQLVNLVRNGVLALPVSNGACRLHRTGVVPVYHTIG